MSAGDKINNPTTNHKENSKATAVINTPEKSTTLKAIAPNRAK